MVEKDGAIFLKNKLKTALLPDLRIHNEFELELEPDLIREVAKGSETAFGRLVQLYWERLNLYLNKIVKSEVVAEELTDDIFVQLWLKRQLLEGVRSFDQYLFRMARNKSIDFLRLATRDKKLQQIIHHYSIAVDGHLPDHNILTTELRTLLSEVMETLSPQRKLVFTLKHLEGMTNDQIASQLNLSKNTIKNTLNDSLKQLRVLLQKHGVQGIWLLTWLLDR